MRTRCCLGGGWRGEEEVCAGSLVFMCAHDARVQRENNASRTLCDALKAGSPWEASGHGADSAGLRPCWPGLLSSLWTSSFSYLDAGQQH